MTIRRKMHANIFSKNILIIALFMPTLTRLDVFRPSLDDSLIDLSLDTRQLCEVIAISVQVFLSTYFLVKKYLSKRVMPNDKVLYLFFIMFFYALLSCTYSVDAKYSALRAGELISVAILTYLIFKINHEDKLCDYIKLLFIWVLIGVSNSFLAALKFQELELQELIRSNYFSIPASICVLSWVAFFRVAVFKKSFLIVSLASLLVFRSMGSVMALLVALMPLIIWRVIRSGEKSYSRKTYIFVFFMYVIIVFVNIPVFGELVSEFIGQLMGRSSDRIANFTGRLNVWSALIEYIGSFNQGVWLGSGYQAGIRISYFHVMDLYYVDTTASHGHNEFFNIVLSQGLIGVFIWLMLIFILIYQAFRARGVVAELVPYILLFCLINGLVTSVITTPFGISLLVMLGVISSKSINSVPVKTKQKHRRELLSRAG